MLEDYFKILKTMPIEFFIEFNSDIFNQQGIFRLTYMYDTIYFIIGNKIVMEVLPNGYISNRIDKLEVRNIVDLMNLVRIFKLKEILK